MKKNLLLILFLFATILLSAQSIELVYDEKVLANNDESGLKSMKYLEMLKISFAPNPKGSLIFSYFSL